MIGEKMFSSYEKQKDSKDSITFGDVSQAQVNNLGKIAISPNHYISNVFLVDSLDYNILYLSIVSNGLQLLIYWYWCYGF
jgi:hypothetical protein